MKVGHGFSNLAQSTDCGKVAYMGAKPINIHVHGQNAANEYLCSLFPSCFEQEERNLDTNVRVLNLSSSFVVRIDRVTFKFPGNLNFQASSFQKPKVSKDLSFQKFRFLEA